MGVLGFGVRGSRKIFFARYTRNPVYTAMSEVFPKYVANEFFRNRTKGVAFLMNPLM